MGRRTVLLVVAALIAVAGAGMVFLYVKGVDDRAKQAQVPVSVLKAVSPIDPGESLAEASAAGKIQLMDVPAEQRLEGAMDSIGDSGDLAALTRIYPNEQITTAKFGSPGEQENFAMPEGTFAISVDLTDTGRVAGFITPGSTVAVFLTSPGTGEQGAFTRLVDPEVTVVAVAQTTVTTSTTTTGEGGQTTEEIPRTIATLAVDQEEAERIKTAVVLGELSFGLLGEGSQVEPGPGVTAETLFDDEGAR